MLSQIEINPKQKEQTIIGLNRRREWKEKSGFKVRWIIDVVLLNFT